MKTKSLSIAFLLIFSCLIAYAQQERGDKVIRLNGNYTKFGGSSGVAILDVKGGYFFNKNIEAGVEPSMMFGSGFSSVLFGLYGAYNFSINDPRMVPYAGVRLAGVVQSVKVTNINGNSSTKSNGSGDLGIYGGMRYYVSNKVNVDTGISYDVGSLNVFQWTIGVGFAIGR